MRKTVLIVSEEGTLVTALKKIIGLRGFNVVNALDYDAARHMVSDMVTGVSQGEKPFLVVNSIEPETARDVAACDGFLDFLRESSSGTKSIGLTPSDGTGDYSKLGILTFPKSEEGLRRFLVALRFVLNSA